MATKKAAKKTRRKLPGSGGEEDAKKTARRLRRRRQEGCQEDREEGQEVRSRTLRSAHGCPRAAVWHSSRVRGVFALGPECVVASNFTHSLSGD